MTSAFITQVQPELQPDPNEETAALLRVLIYKVDNTTFGGDVPALPQWTGPPRMVIQVQCILYASLSASLLAAFLAMLGKQWLNRYASVDMRGSTIERSQNRQRKLDGIVAWHFNHVLESLPLMLQTALLLLGCALPRYLWGTNILVASVCLGFTAFGALLYAFILVAGAISESCPYQTPWTNGFRRLLFLFAKHSTLYRTLFERWNDLKSINQCTFSVIAILMFPIVLLASSARDFLRIGRATFRSSVVFVRRVRGWLSSTPLIPMQAFDYQEAKLDFCCISWMLQTSMDKTINLLTLGFLETILTPPGFNSNIVADCFEIFSNCFVQNDGNNKTIVYGSQSLAEISAMCFFCAFSHLLVVEPTYIIKSMFREPSIHTVFGLIRLSQETNETVGIACYKVRADGIGYIDAYGIKDKAKGGEEAS